MNDFFENELLRQQAEELIDARTADIVDNSSLEMEKTLHELHVHQIELELQNEELQKVYIELDHEKERYFDLYEHAPIGYCTLNFHGVIIQTNQTAALLLDHQQCDIRMHPFSTFIFSEDQDIYYLYLKQLLNSESNPSCELRMFKKNQTLFWVNLTTTIVRDSHDSPLWRVVISDISERKNYEIQLQHIAQYDPLTSLPNRILLADRLNQAIAHTNRRKQPLAVLYLDLDGFKRINDTFGHDAGDQLLIALANNMKQSLREIDTIARIGGDEFIIILIDLDDIKDCDPMLNRLLMAAEQAVYVDNNLLQVSASLGVTFFPQSIEVDADQLIRQADYAMYQAKLAGKNRYYVFDTEQNKNMKERYVMIDHIRHALKTEEFVLFYQPKVNMRTGIIIGAEALIRWMHPTKGLLSPDMFLPFIEDHPLSVDIGEWVIQTTLKQIDRWNREGLRIPISVNIGAKQLQQENFIPRLQEMLSKSPDLSPFSLELEILETSALEDVKRAVNVIKACRELGVNISLDDFGTGYSSLTYLKQLPVALLKIDQSFVHGMLVDPDDLAILKGIIGLARAFHREVIAEGVETFEHGKALLSLGCELAQGFAIAKAMPAEDFHHWSNTWNTNPLWRNG